MTGSKLVGIEFASRGGGKLTEIHKKDSTVCGASRGVTPTWNR